MKRIISLSKADVVFHGTPMSASLKILRNNEFLLSSNVHSNVESQIISKYPFYLSTTRSRTGSFHSKAYHSDRDIAVLFTLDGRKLGHNHKMQPVSYWTHAFGDQSQDPTFRSDNDEAEERILTRQPRIKNALQYITKVEVYIESHADAADARRLMIICKKNSIPCYVYGRHSYWVLGDTRKAIPANIIAKAPSEKEEPIDYHDLNEYAVHATQLLVLVSSPVTAKLPKETEKYLTRLSRLPHSMLWGEISRALRQIQSSPIDKHRRIYEKLSLAVRKAGDTKALAKKLTEKWKPKYSIGR